MKDVKLIEAIVFSYFNENKDIDTEKLKDILVETLAIKIGDVKLKNNTLKVYYGESKKRKKVEFEIIRKDENE